MSVEAEGKGGALRCRIGQAASTSTAFRPTATTSSAAVMMAVISTGLSDLEESACIQTFMKKKGASVEDQKKGNPTEKACF